MNQKTLARWLIDKTNTEKYRAGQLSGWKHPKITAEEKQAMGGRQAFLTQVRYLEKETEAGKAGRLTFDWINVNTDDFPEDIASVAASMHVITGAYYKRAEIIADTWKAFEKYYDLFVQTENLALMVDAYNQRLVNMDRRVMIEERGHRYEGTARGIDSEGALLVERDDGTTTSVISGEVSVRGVLGYV